MRIIIHDCLRNVFAELEDQHRSTTSVTWPPSSIRAVRTRLAASIITMEKCFELAAQGRLQELMPMLAGNRRSLKATDARGRTLLHAAAECGQREVAKYLIDEVDGSHASLDIKDDDGNTALHLAVLNCHVDVADLLLSSGASAIVQNNRRMLPLHVALRKKECTEIVTIFTKYHDIDHKFKGFRDYTSLHIIAATNNLKALKILYEAAASGKPDDITDILQLQSVDRDGLTPIHLAARKGSYDVLDFMISKAIQHGLQPQKVFECLSEKESTPLHFAVESNSLQIVRILLKHGASSTAASGKQGPPIHLACSQNKLSMVRVMVEHCGRDILNCKNKQGQTPLHSCVTLLGGKQLVSFLLSCGSLLDMRDTSGHTPLQLAVRLGNVASVEQLLASGSSPLIKNVHGCNCLHIAIMFKRKEVFKRLLEHSCCTEMCDMSNNEGDLPIHLALREGLSSFVMPLLKSTLREVTDKEENNYFHLAALSGDDKTIETLLNYPFAESMINATNSSGKTPLHCSGISGNLAIISLLLDHGAMVNKCHIGRTPFMYACSKGKLQSAKVLYEAHPFQRDWKDDQGNTALHLAACSGSTDVTLYCLDLGTVVSLNDKQNSFFDIIIKAVDSNLAETVLQHKRWEECLDTSCPTKPHPVKRLICRIPTAFQVVLNQSIQRSTLNPQHKDYWEKYNFKYISLPLDPTPHIMDGSGRDDMKNKSASQKETRVHVSAPKERVHQKRSKSEAEVQLQMETFPRHEESGEPPEDANLRLETVQDIQSPSNSDTAPLKKEEESSQSHMTAEGLNNNRRRHVPSMKVLKLLAKKRVKQCLTHPLVSKYLYLKWVDYARTLYVGKFLLILLMAVFLSTFVGIAPIPPQGLMAPTVGIGNGTPTNLTLETEEEISMAANVIRFVTIFFAALNAVIWLSTIYVLRFKLITHVVQEFEFWIYGCAIVSTLVYLIPFHGLNSVIYEAGAIAAFTIWFVALLQIELFAIGDVGIYISMLLSTTKNVLKVLAICFFLFCAFAFSFHILVGSFSELQFTNIGTSLVSSLSSALAIVDLNTFVALEFAGVLRFRVLTFIMYILILIILPIVVINLLIGLAVGDIAKIQQEAEISRQVFVVTNLSKIDERLLPRKLLLRFCRDSYMYRPNATVGSRFRRLFKFMKQNMMYDSEGMLVDDVAMETEGRDQEEELLTLRDLKHQVDQLTQTQGKQVEAMARMELMLQKLMDHQGVVCD